MVKMKLALMTVAVMVATLLAGGPIAQAQTKADVVKAVSNESDSRAWLADDPHRFGHPDRPEKNAVLAQCFQDALASGDHPKLEAAFLANKAYLEAKISSAITFASENNWNALESTYLAFQLMNKGEDEEEQARFFSEWILGWGNSFGDDTESMNFSDIDRSAQAEVEAMYDACADRGDMKRASEKAAAAESEPTYVDKHAGKIHLTWEANILPGDLDEIKSLARRWETIAAKDPNTLYTKWVIKEDSSAVRLDALFVDGKSSQEQFPKNLWHHLDALIANGKLDATGMVIGGKLNEWTKFLRGFGATFMLPLATSETKE